MANEEEMAKFTKLFREFELSDALLKWVTSSTGLRAKKVKDLEYAMTSETDAYILISRAGIKEENGDALIETSRLRHLWASLKSIRRDDEAIAKRGLDEIDLDGLLSQPELDTIQQRFMARKHGGKKIRLEVFMEAIYVAAEE